MELLGIVGWQNCGKTTLIASLIPALRTRGLTVSTVKHVHHAVELDTPGKDTWVHRQAGATEVMMVSADRWALLHERPSENLPFDNPTALLAHMTPVDLVLVEGFKALPIDKSEVHDAASSNGLIQATDSHVVAVAASVVLQGLRVPAFMRDDIGAIADFIRSRQRRNHPPALRLVGSGRPGAA